MIKKFLALSLIVLYYGCTHNPFFGDEIKENDHLSFKGTVQLQDTDDHSGIVVYLEGLDIFTETDEKGDFKINLDLGPQYQPGHGLTGFYKVYYYVSNYKLHYSTVFMNNGEFAFSVADLNDKGEILHRITLKKLLDVKTTVEPELIQHNYGGKVSINVLLDNKIDTVIVYSYVKGSRLGSVYLERVNGDGPELYMLVDYSVDYTWTIVDSARSWLMELDWPYVSQYIDIGLYDVTPFLHVYQENIPQALLDKIGTNVTRFTPEYLDVPFHGQKGLLSIHDDL